MRPTLIGRIGSLDLQKDNNISEKREEFIKYAEKRTGKTGYTLMIARANFGTEKSKKEAIIG